MHEVPRVVRLLGHERGEERRRGGVLAEQVVRAGEIVARGLGPLLGRRGGARGLEGLVEDAGRDLDGRSMLDPLRSGDWSVWRRRLVVENTNMGWALLREGSHAYNEHYGSGEWELYDLARDPHQLAGIRDADVTDWARRTGQFSASRGRALRALEQ